MRFDQDLARWENGEISLVELMALHPDRDVPALLRLRNRLASVTTASPPEPGPGWEALRGRLPDRRTSRSRPIWRSAQRRVVVAAATTLLTAGVVLAVEPVRHGTATLLSSIARIFGDGIISLLDSQNPPTVGALILTADEDTILRWTPDVTDDDGDALTCSIVSPAGHGTVTVNHDCTGGTYLPAPDFNGKDRFAYRAGDGEAFSDTAPVSLTIRQVNDRPVARVDNVVTDEDTSVTIDVLANDSDVDGDSLLLSPGAAGGSHPRDTAWSLRSIRGGSATLTSRGDGRLSYTPPLNFGGTDSVRYTVWDRVDGFDSGRLSVLVKPVNDPPLAAAMSERGDEDIAIEWIPSVRDVERDALTCSIGTQSNHGDAQVRSDCSRGTYIPDPDSNGPDAFTYVVSDGTDTSDPAAVRLTVHPVNDVPVAEELSVSGEEDRAIEWVPSVSDIEGGPLECSIEAQPDHGTAEVSPDCSLGTYVPDPDSNGADSFTYVVSDGADTSDPATVTLSVLPTNDRPVAIDDAAVTEADSPVTIQVTANDTDVDGDPLTVGLVTSPANGAIAVNGDGTLTYTPNPGFTGNDSLTYEISDGLGGTAIGTVVVTVIPAPAEEGEGDVPAEVG